MKYTGLGFLAAAIAAAVLTSVSASCPAQAVAGVDVPPPVGDFFKQPVISRPLMSPDGRHVAVAMSGPNGRMRLAVIDPQHLDQSKLVASFDDADVADYRWVNDTRLVYWLADRQSAVSHFGPGLWAVNSDGTESRELIKVNQVIGGISIIKDRRLPPNWWFHATVRDGSADVIVAGTELERPAGAGWIELYGFTAARLDTRTGLSRNLLKGTPAHVSSALTDPVDGTPVALTTSFEGRYASYLKVGSEWKQWESGDELTDAFALPLFLTPKGDLLVSARRGADTQALFSVDRSSLKLSDKPIIDLDGYDFRGSSIYNERDRRLLGFRYETDAQGTAWFDAGMREVQAQVDKLLPATTNRIDCGRCDKAAAVVVTASSDRQPPVYYLYKPDSQELQTIAASMPWITPQRMGQRDVFRFKARDGLSIPVLVTQPPGKAATPRPAVMLVHGGPNVRGTHWAWERDAQFLASRGYVVIEPEFRGSTGYGWQLFRAGWKQWGLAMQDDVEDAMKWAAGKGWIDPQRVCIAGASYGGYATLMGLIKTPELYQCGFQWVGVSDLSLKYSIQWSDASDEWKRYGMPILVGDPVKDAAQFTATSPLAQAARLKRPLLMGYGGEDRRVPMKHGTDMRDALVAAGNKDIEWVSYPDEGHGWWELKNNVDWWARVEKFLDRHIGAGAAKAQEPKQ